MVDKKLVVCETCTNRKMNFDKGMVCGLTNEKPTFIDLCADFIKDEDVKYIRNPESEVEVSDIQYKISDRALLKLKEEQNLPIGILVSFTVGIFGALIWAAITVATEFQIGYMAIAIGAGVGYSLRLVGKGIDQVFGITGAIIAVLSCLLGNVFTLIGFVANAESLSYMDTLLAIDYSLIPSALAENFSPIDLLFYGIAGYEGYKFSFRKFTEIELNKLEK